MYVKTGNFNCTIFYAEVLSLGSRLFHFISKSHRAASHEHHCEIPLFSCSIFSLTLVVSCHKLWGEKWWILKCLSHAVLILLSTPCIFFILLSSSSINQWPSLQEDTSSLTGWLAPRNRAGIAGLRIEQINDYVTLGWWFFEWLII